MKRYISIVICTTSLILTSCQNNDQQSMNNKNGNDQNNKVIITISAAASLKDALTKIEQQYESAHPNIDIKINYGASGALAQQIKSGAPVNLFFSAAEDKVEDLITSGNVVKSETKPLIKNKLVLVSNKKKVSLNALNDNDIDKIAIGEPKTVPAGQYAQQALENSSEWDKLKHKFIYAKDVRQVLTYVETENTDAGIVYNSDALQSEKIKYKTNIDETLHDDIIYPLAIIKNSKNSAETLSLYQYLQSKESMKIYESYGFVTK